MKNVYILLYAVLSTITFLSPDWLMFIVRNFANYLKNNLPLCSKLPTLVLWQKIQHKAKLFTGYFAPTWRLYPSNVGYTVGTVRKLWKFTLNISFVCKNFVKSTVAIVKSSCQLISRNFYRKRVIFSHTVDREPTQ